MKILYKDYSTKDSAFLAIRNQVTEFYTASNPALLTDKKVDIEAAIVEIQNAVFKEYFPVHEIKLEILSEQHRSYGI